MGERTELPSQRRLDEARERGQVAKSQDLVAAVDLVAVLVVAVVFGGNVAKALADCLREGLTAGFSPLSTPALATTIRESVMPAAIATAPVLGALFVVTASAHLLQTGLLWSSQGMMPKLDKLDPLKGFGRIFGRRNAVRTIVSVIKLSIIVWISYLFLRGRVGSVAMLPQLTALEAYAALAKLAIRLAIWLLSLLVTIGVIDFLFQKWQHTQDLRMTRQEVQDERRSMDGDPHVKGRRQRMMRQIALQRINQAVPRADVVVTNPTHYSVAIQYDAKTMRAPKVVAKGADHLALRIRQIAAANGVPMVERPPLARALFASAEPGQEISPEYYQAVAEVLAYVYRLDREAA